MTPRRSATAKKTITPHLKNPPPIKRKDLYQKRELDLEVLPAWDDIEQTERQSIVQSRVDKMTHQEKTPKQKEGKRVLGVRRVKAKNRMKGNPPPSSQRPVLADEENELSPLLQQAQQQKNQLLTIKM